MSTSESVNCHLEQVRHVSEEGVRVSREGWVRALCERAPAQVSRKVGLHVAGDPHQIDAVRSTVPDVSVICLSWPFSRVDATNLRAQAWAPPTAPSPVYIDQQEGCARGNASIRILYFSCEERSNRPYQRDLRYGDVELPSGSRFLSYRFIDEVALSAHRPVAAKIPVRRDGNVRAAKARRNGRSSTEALLGVRRSAKAVSRGGAVRCSWLCGSCTSVASNTNTTGSLVFVYLALTLS